MNRRIFISRSPGETRLALVADDRPTDFWIERDCEPSLIGRHFAARIRRIERGLGGAFVELADGVEAFLTLRGGAGTSLAEGGLILVNVTQDAAAGKLPRAEIGARCVGASLAFDPTGTASRCSRRVTGKAAKARLLDLARTWPGEGGYTFRKAAAYASDDALAEEAQLLFRQGADLIEAASGAKSAGPLSDAVPIAERFLLALHDGALDETVFDQGALKTVLENAVARWPSLRAPAFRFHGSQEGPLFEAAGIADEIEELGDSALSLQGGGTLHIEATRTATLIDVDSGPAELRGRRAEALRAFNSAAAMLVARQIRLRGIGGMILVDFAGASLQKPDRGPMNVVRRIVADDPWNVRVLGYSRLGLLEMTRRRGRTPLFDLLRGDKSAERTTAALELLRAMSMQIRRGGGARPCARVSAALSDRIAEPDLAAARRELDTEAGEALEFILDPALPPLAFVIA